MIYGRNNRQRCARVSDTTPAGARGRGEGRGSVRRHYPGRRVFGKLLLGARGTPGQIAAQSGGGGHSLSAGRPSRIAQRSYALQRSVRLGQKRSQRRYAPRGVRPPPYHARDRASIGLRGRSKND